MKTLRSGSLVLSLALLLPGGRLFSADTLRVGAGQPYGMIQAAIDAAAGGDVVLVYDGTYVENVYVDRPIHLVSADYAYNGGNEGAVIDAGGSSAAHGIAIRTARVFVAGFSIFGATGTTPEGHYRAGICLDRCIESMAVYNRCGWDEQHVNSVGILILESGRNAVINNTLARNIHGIMLSETRWNIVTGNTARGCTSGIYVVGSYGFIAPDTMDATTTGNAITYNTLVQNSIGLEVNSYCWRNRAESNRADSNTIGIYFGGDCRNNHVVGNTVRDNSTRGIHVNYSSDFTIYHNVVDNNAIGIWLGYSAPSDYGANNCEVWRNSITHNAVHGIRVSYQSRDNRIALNGFSGNGENVHSEGTSWESATPLSYFHGGNWKSALGNYYDTYAGTDPNGDGVGETDLPFTDKDSVYGPRENYPLTAPPETYDVQAWYLAGDSARTMFRGNERFVTGEVAIEPSLSVVWTSDTPATTDVAFPSAPWSGKLRFTEALPPGAMEATIGSSTGGGDFTPTGATATVGNGEEVSFETSPASVTVTNGRYLALRITNTTATRYTVVTGGSVSYCSSTGMGDPLWPGSSTDVGDRPSEIQEYSLLEPFPNPFNPSTTIKYTLPQRSHVILTVFNTLGQKVTTLVDETVDAGDQSVEFDASGLASGVYLYRLQAGDFASVKKLVILK